MKDSNKAFILLSVFILTLSISLYSVLNKKQLGLMGGLTEEYFSVAYNVYSTGEMFEFKETPVVFRPPGYIWFLTSIFSMNKIEKSDEIIYRSEKESNRFFGQVSYLVIASQVFLFSVSVLCLYSWCSILFSKKASFIISLCYGFNAYLIILCGLINYSVVHLFFVIISGYYLTKCFHSEFTKRGVFWAGILWGLTTLIRPFTLILPIFVLLGAKIVFKNEIRKMITFSLVFLLGMIVVVAPYTVRNYVLTKRLIPVNAQTWASLWAATEKRESFGPNYYNWGKLWHPKGESIYQKVTHTEKYSITEYLRNNLALEDAFKRETINNIMSTPHIYLLNCFWNTKSFIFDINSVLVRIFQVAQDPAVKIEYWKFFKEGSPQQLSSSVATRIFEGLFYLLTFLSFLGGYFAIRDKDKRLIVPALIIGCFCFAHAITYLDFFYYYVKLPFLFIFAGYAISAMTSKDQKGDPDQKMTHLAVGLVILLVGLTGVLNYMVIIA